jgi:hypothetical protein
VTVFATNVTSTNATLNGVAYGFGDPTQFFFQLCPPGATVPNGCSSTPTNTIPTGSPPTCCLVSAGVGRLKPDTTYRFRIVVKNADGTTTGNFQTFKTAKKQVISPIQSVSAPNRVKHGKTFEVKVKLRTTASVKIYLLFKGKTVKFYNEGTRTGTVTQKIKAPNKKGTYTLRVTATGGGTTQTVNKTITVF